jgi:hypothetical protein
MLLRDKRLWLGLAIAVVLAFVSYAVVVHLNTPGRPVADSSSLPAAPPPTTTTAPHIPPGDALIPPVVGERLPQAKAQLTLAGLSNVSVQDASGQNRIVLEDNNWIVDSQSPQVGIVVDGHTQIVLKVRKPTDSHIPPSVPFGTIPDVVCASLENAYNALHASGFLVTTASDATGAGRSTLLDRNWVVLGQSAAPNSRPSVFTHITLSVVMYGEPTGDTGCQS